MSLKQKLTEHIKSEDGRIVNLQSIKFICKQEGRKLSNAERRLRDSESPEIGKVLRNGAIIGYFWRKGEHLAENAPVESKTAPQREEKHTPDTCYSFKKFGVYCRECREVKI